MQQGGCSSFLMLESILKANKRDAFNNCLDFPHSLRKLKIYYQFVGSLIFHLKRKYVQELISLAYYSAAILNVSKISAWIDRILSVEFVRGNL